MVGGNACGHRAAAPPLHRARRARALKLNILKSSLAYKGWASSSGHSGEAAEKWDDPGCGAPAHSSAGTARQMAASASGRPNPAREAGQGGVPFI